MNDDRACEPIPDAESRLSLLTPGEQACLLLVMEHLSSKEIARRLAISPHTVDQRMRCALRKLGVDRRTDAGRLLQAWGETKRPSQAILPFATRRHAFNNMSVHRRLLWIATICIAASFAAGLSLAGAEAVAHLVRDW